MKLDSVYAICRSQIRSVPLVQCSARIVASMPEPAGAPGNSKQSIPTKTGQALDMETSMLRWANHSRSVHVPLLVLASMSGELSRSDSTRGRLRAKPVECSPPLRHFLFNNIHRIIFFLFLSPSVPYLLSIYCPWPCVSCLTTTLHQVTDVKSGTN